jgi:membrane protease YdiL (CAAX protease family)
VYVLLPALRLDLRRIASKIGLSALHVYYLIMAFWEVVTVAILLALVNGSGLPLSTLGFRGGLSLEGILYAAVGVIVGALLYPAIQRLMRALGWSMFWPRRESQDPFPRDSSHLATRRGLLSMIVIVVVCIPILEETIYRGYVQTALTQNLDSLLLAFLLSSLVFASIHILSGPGFILLIFVGTLWLSFVYWKTGSIYPGILMHSVNTLLGEVVFPAIEQTGKRG